MLFKNGGENKSIIYGPLVQYTANGEQQLDVTTQMEVNREEGDTIVSLKIDEGILDDGNTEFPVRLDPSFEMYLNKMPDSTVYKKHNVNNYLANYAVVGDHPVWGEGWHYLRFRLNYILTIQSAKVDSVSFFVPVLKQNSSLALSPVEKQWSSTTITWDVRSFPTSEESLKGTLSSRMWEIDVTDYAISCFEDTTWLKESYGLLITSDSDKYSILSTSDNSLYSPYIVVVLNRLPAYFEPQDNINPT